MFGAKQQVPHGDEDYKETKRQRQCNSWRYQLGGGPFRAKRCRSFTILRRGELSGAEHELGLLGLIFLIQVASSLISPNATMGLLYILAGVR
jgi:hypothetical protein